MLTQILICLFLVASSKCGVIFPEYESEKAMNQFNLEQLWNVNNYEQENRFTDDETAVEEIGEITNVLRRFFARLSGRTLTGNTENRKTAGKKNKDYIVEDPEMIVFPPSFMCVSIDPEHQVYPLPPPSDERPKRLCTRMGRSNPLADIYYQTNQGPIITQH